MKLLLTGKNGQVGFELQRALAPLGEIVAVDMAECDLSNPDAIRRLVSETRPDIIINPAAYTAVDKAETDQDLAYAVNGMAPGVLGEEAKKLGALVIHYSTDYVFDGTKQGAYSENDAPNPQSIYGKSKLAGEQALLRSAADHFIFRTSWVFGAHGNNFAKTMLRLAVDRDTLNVVVDQFGAPTSAALLADITAHVIARYQREGRAAQPFGIYHLVASSLTTWHDYAQTVVRAAIAAGKPLKLSPENIKAITTAEYPLPAPRPTNSHLDTCKLQETFGLILPPWQNGLNHVLQQIL
ncbi:dTDP-4-dehydrorhamnose reductase [Quatrionicoccus australiensis]|nr:dTDP-4-dehydrorhamnose reductase [Quatrionicoccus australiensis]